MTSSCVFWLSEDSPLDVFEEDDEEEEEDDEDDDSVDETVLDNSITVFSAFCVAVSLSDFDDVSDDVKLPLGWLGVSSSSMASLVCLVDARCFSASADPIAFASVMCSIIADPSIFTSVTRSIFIGLAFAPSSGVSSGVSDVSKVGSCRGPDCLARASFNSPISSCASFNLSLTLGVVLAAVDIDKPPEIGPWSVFARSCSIWSVLNSNWVPVISASFSAASFASVASSLVSSSSLALWYTFPKDAMDLSLPSLVCAGVVASGGSRLSSWSKLVASRRDASVIFVDCISAHLELSPHGSSFAISAESFSLDDVVVPFSAFHLIS